MILYTTMQYLKIQKLKELNGDFTIMDGSKIQAEHEEKWEKYYKEKQEER